MDILRKKGKILPLKPGDFTFAQDGGKNTMRSLFGCHMVEYTCFACGRCSIRRSVPRRGRIPSAQ